MGFGFFVWALGVLEGLCVGGLYLGGVWLVAYGFGFGVFVLLGLGFGGVFTFCSGLGFGFLFVVGFVLVGWVGFVCFLAWFGGFCVVFGWLVIFCWFGLVWFEGGGFFLGGGLLVIFCWLGLVWLYFTAAAFVGH